MLILLKNIKHSLSFYIIHNFGVWKLKILKKNLEVIKHSEGKLRISKFLELVKNGNKYLVSY